MLKKINGAFSRINVRFFGTKVFIYGMIMNRDIIRIKANSLGKFSSLSTLNIRRRLYSSPLKCPYSCYVQKVQFIWKRKKPRLLPGGNVQRLVISMFLLRITPPSVNRDLPWSHSPWLSNSPSEVRARWPIALSLCWIRCWASQEGCSEMYNYENFKVLNRSCAWRPGWKCHLSVYDADL